MSHWPSTHGEDLCLGWTHSPLGQTAQQNSELWRIRVLNKESILSTPYWLKSCIESHHPFRSSVGCLLPSSSHTSVHVWTNPILTLVVLDQKCLQLYNLRCRDHKYDQAICCTSSQGQELGFYSGKICGYDLGFAPRLAVYPHASQFISFCLFLLLKKMLWNLPILPRYYEDIRIKFLQP